MSTAPAHSWYYSKDSHHCNRAGGLCQGGGQPSDHSRGVRAPGTRTLRQPKAFPLAVSLLTPCCKGYGKEIGCFIIPSTPHLPLYPSKSFKLTTKIDPKGLEEALPAWHFPPVVSLPRAADLLWRRLPSGNLPPGSLSAFPPGQPMAPPPTQFLSQFLMREAKAEHAKHWDEHPKEKALLLHRQKQQGYYPPCRG